MRVSRFVTPVCLAVTLVAVVAAAACGREQGPEAASIGTVIGAVIEVEATSIVETKMLRVRDGSGRVWTFDALDYRGFTPSHLRAHMLQGLGVLVRFRRDDGVLRVLEITDR